MAKFAFRMNDLHRFGVSVAGSENNSLEGTTPNFSLAQVKAGILKAQKKSWNVLQEIRLQIREGMTEDDARKVALDVFRDHGVTKHWHRPFIRLGAGTTLTFNDPIQKDYRLQNGEPYYLDFGPVWSDLESGLEYEGDVGDTFILGSNPEAEKCIQASHTLFYEARNRWKEQSLSGSEIYKFLLERASSLGYLLANPVHGHRVSDFPHHKYSKSTLAAVEFCPQETLWILEVQVLHPTLKIGSFFEDLL